MALRGRQPICVVCKVPVTEHDAVGLVGRARVFTCEGHKAAVELTVRVGGAAARAGLEAAVEARAPGLLGKMTKALRVLRGEE